MQDAEHGVRRGAAAEAELERRLRLAQRAPDTDLGRLLDTARSAVADDLSSTVQFGSDVTIAEAAHRKWQLIHRYMHRLPFRDDPAASRPAQWQRALQLVRPIEDLDLIEWVSSQVDAALSREARARRGLLEERRNEPVYLVLLRHVAARKRQARAELGWAREAEAKGWGTCNVATLGSNVLDLHAASVHSRDNPAYAGPVDGAYRKD
jgi:hypothetical protein